MTAVVVRVVHFQSDLELHAYHSLAWLPFSPPEVYASRLAGVETRRGYELGQLTGGKAWLQRQRHLLFYLDLAGHVTLTIQPDASPHSLDTGEVIQLIQRLLLPTTLISGWWKRDLWFRSY